MKEKLEEMVRKHGYAPKYQVEVMGRKIDVPVKYSDVSALVFLFPAAVKNVKKFIKTGRFLPVHISKGRCLLCVTIFDYKTCQIGAYKEIALSVPVLLDSKVSIPYLPLFLNNFFPTFGYYTILLAMNTDAAIKHAEQIFGYPTHNQKIDIDIKRTNNQILVVSTENNKKIMSMSVGIEDGSGPKKEIAEKYRTYFVKGNDIIEVQLNAFSYIKKLSRGKNFALEFGDHEISKMLRELSLEPYPLRSISYEDATEILSVPRVVGHV